MTTLTKGVRLIEAAVFAVTCTCGGKYEGIAAFFKNAEDIEAVFHR